MKRPLVLAFPGQGSQYVGMGEKLFQTNEKAAQLLKSADQTLGFTLSQLISEGPEEKLKLTENTQPAILTYSVALLDLVNEHLNQTPDFVLGHSVGEYAALVAAGALTFEDAVKAVHLRGQYMQQAVPEGKGSMYAILRASEEAVVKACESASTAEESVAPANYNDPTQIVISGHTPAVERAVKHLQDNVDRVRCMPLAVSAPFHSKLMGPAAKKLATHFESVTFHATKLPYVANVDAKVYQTNTPGETVRNNLVEQVCASVLWTQSIQQLPSQSKVIEVGPGRVLAGLIRKINPEIEVLSMDKVIKDEDKDALREFLS